MWRWPVLLISVLFAVELLVVGVTRLVYFEGIPDPFAPYAAIVSGQSVGALQPYPCKLQELAGMRNALAYCEIHQSEGSFERVIVTVNINTASIQQLTFRARGLRLGDLVLRWGRAYTVERYRGGTVARWRGGGYAFISSAGNSLYLAPVNSIVIGQVMSGQQAQ